MSNVELGNIPDGRVRINRLLSEGQKAALMTLKIEGLILLNIKEIVVIHDETWIDYWFDKDMVTEEEIRTQINQAILSSE